MSNSKVSANQAANVANVATTSASSLERKQINCKLLKCNLSQLFKRCTSETTIPAELVKLAKEAASFSSFRSHMVARHKLPEGAEYPRNGWSPWYALEWFEQQVKAAAADESNPAHKKAVAYLRKTRAELQDEAAKLM